MMLDKREKIQIQQDKNAIINCKNTHLFLVTHGSLSSDHDLASGLQFQLFCRHTAWTQNSSDKVKLITEI